MKHFSLNAWNDWRWVGSYRADVTLLRVNFDYLRAMFVSVDVVLLGFGFSLTYYPHGKHELSASWGEAIGAALKTYSWEPIETDGWAGEAQGMEKAP